MKHRFSKYSYL